MCYKLHCYEKADHYNVKPKTNEFPNSIPGLNTACEEMKPYDNNLSPLQIENLKPIQYGDTSIASTCTDNPVWSPGQCLDISKYEGIFIKKKISMNSKVVAKFLTIGFSFYYFRILKEQKIQRSERLLL